MPTKKSKLTPKEIQTLTDLGLDPNSKNLKEEIAQKILELKEKNKPPISNEIDPLKGVRGEDKAKIAPSKGLATQSSGIFWHKLPIAEFNKNFRSTKWGKNRFIDDLSFFYPLNETAAMLEYGEFWGLTEIFGVYSSGVETGKDELFIKHKSEESLKIVNDFNLLNAYEVKEKYNIKVNSGWTFDTKFKNDAKCLKYCYKPFDTRYICWTSSLRRSFKDMFNNLINGDNLGLVFPRISHNESFDYGFVANSIIDRSLGGKNSGSETYLAPLYLYKNDLEGARKEVNFRPEFADFVDKKFGNPSPEAVLGFIYASMHSPTYRNKYLELLKIDFPRINFDVDLAEFKRLANIGHELIDAHLMRKIPNTKIGEPEADGEQNFVVEKVRYDADLQRLYFNKTCYFVQVSPDVWNYKIGGYQVLDKYLKSRKDMDITGDLDHIQKIIKVLNFTVDAVKEVDGMK